MGKARHLFKKIGDTKGTFHVKMGTIKDRNSKDLTEAEEIKKRQKEYTGEPYTDQYECLKISVLTGKKHFSVSGPFTQAP